MQFPPFTIHKNHHHQCRRLHHHHHHQRHQHHHHLQHHQHHYHQGLSHADLIMGRGRPVKTLSAGEDLICQ